MVSSLSNLVDKLAEGIHKIKLKYCDCFIQYEGVKDNLIKWKCLFFNKIYLNIIDEELKKKKDSRPHLRFLIMILINLFCC